MNRAVFALSSAAAVTQRAKFFLGGITPRSWLPPRRLFISIMAPVISLVLMAAAVALIDHTAYWHMVADPNALLNGKVYTGAITFLGVLLWWGSGAIGVFAGLWLTSLDRQRGLFLILMGGIALVLAADDLLLLHEIVLPHFGVSEAVVYAAYAASIMLIILLFARQWVRSELFWLALGLGSLAVSMAADVVLPVSRIAGFAEEMTKFVGIAGWSTYLARTSWLWTRADMRPAGHGL